MKYKRGGGLENINRPQVSGRINILLEKKLSEKNCVRLRSHGKTMKPHDEQILRCFFS